jgi:predicted DNA-binding transcriptional regulator AlpA
VEELKNMPMILTPKEVSKILGITQGQAYRLFNSKKFPSEKIQSKHFIPKPRFIQWMGYKEDRSC